MKELSATAVPSMEVVKIARKWRIAANARILSRPRQAEYSTRVGENPQCGRMGTFIKKTRARSCMVRPATSNAFTSRPRMIGRVTMLARYPVSNSNRMAMICAGRSAELRVGTGTANARTIEPSRRRRAQPATGERPTHAVANPQRRDSEADRSDPKRQDDFAGSDEHDHRRSRQRSKPVAGPRPAEPRAQIFFRTLGGTSVQQAGSPLGSG
jgi:hypothetical protein